MKDYLARTTYAEKIATEIAEHYDSEKSAVLKGEKKEQENIVFAVSGKWGEGKTSLLSFLEGPLTEKGFKVIKFNPWKYSQEDISLKRAFLCTIRKGLGSPVNLDDLYYDRTKTTLNISWINWKLLASCAVIIAFTVIFIIPDILNIGTYKWIVDVWHAIKWFLESPLAAPILTALLIPIIIKIITLNRSSASILTAEEFEKKFDELINGHEKLVIFVDDLDRCNPKTVKVILDSLRTFFQHPECSYVITGDHTVIERYAGDELELPKETTQQQKLQEGRRFLKKLFDVYWRLPLPTPRQFGIYIDQETAGSKIVLNPQQINNLKSFLADDNLFERNPRHVKRFLTKLRFALEGVSLQKKEAEKTANGDESASELIGALKDILDNPDLLGKVLLIEEFFYPIYEKLILHPEELVMHEKNLRAGVPQKDLKIAGKTVLLILDEKGEDLEYLERYVALVNKLPKFTDEDNSTLHEVANYFSFSGSTGLPSLLGPDEANFEQYLKNGQLVDKLGAILDVSKKDKKKSLSAKALDIFDKSTVPAEKLNIIHESIKLALTLNEWAVKLSKWKDKLFTLPPDQQNSLAKDFWSAVLQKKPELLTVVRKEKPEYFELIWGIFSTAETSTLDSNTIPELEKNIKNIVDTEPLNLKGVEEYLKKNDSEEIKKYIETKLNSPDICKKYIEHIKAVGFPDGIIYKIAHKILGKLLNNFDNIDWLVTNKVFVKSVNLFDGAKKNIKNWAKKLEQFIKIADTRSGLELSKEEVIDLVADMPGLISGSADINFFNNVNVQALLYKDIKTDVFVELEGIFLGKAEALEKRKQAAQFLIKNTVWNDVDQNDIYKSLKRINAGKDKISPDLKDKPKEILESWSYTEAKEEDKKENAEKTEIK